MGLDSTNNGSLWMDRVAIELNTAILHSYSKNGVSVVDQHSASEQFMIHFKNEMRERGGCPADWVWLTPSQSGSLTPVYHQEQLHYHLSPKYLRQVIICRCIYSKNTPVGILCLFLNSINVIKQVYANRIFYYRIWCIKRTDLKRTKGSQNAS